MVSISLFHWLETKVARSNMEGFPFLHHLTHLQLYQRLIILHVVVKQIKKTFFPNWWWNQLINLMLVICRVSSGGHWRNRFQFVKLKTFFLLLQLKNQTLILTIKVITRPSLPRWMWPLRLSHDQLDQWVRQIYNWTVNSITGDQM